MIRRSMFPLVVLMAIAGTACWYMWRNTNGRTMAEASHRTSEVSQAKSHIRVHEVRIPRGESMPHDEKVFTRYESADFDAGALLGDELCLGDEINLTFFETLRLGFTITSQMKTKSRRRVYLASSGGRIGTHAVILQKGKGDVVVHAWNDHFNSHFLISCHDHIVWVGELGTETSALLCANGGDSPLSAEDVDPNEPPPEKLSDGSVVVDVLIAQDARSVNYAEQLGLSHDEFAELALQQANTVLEQSGLLDNFSFRLAHSERLSESLGDNPEEVLKRLSLGYELNGVDLDRSVRLIRESYDADLAIVLMDSENSLGGISQGLRGVDYKMGVQCVYGVCDMRSAILGYTLAHELGHLFGAGHSDEQDAQKGPQLFDFSAGCYGDGWYSVMSYPKSGHLLRMGEFSSPRLSGNDKHDNVRTIRLTYARISNYQRAKDAVSRPMARKAEKCARVELPHLSPPVGSSSNATLVTSVPVSEDSVVAVEIGGTEREETSVAAPRRRCGKSSVTLEEFGRFVRGVGSGEAEGRIVAALPPGAVLNFDTKQMAEEFKANHPDVIEVLTDFLPDGVALEQLSSGRIVPEDEDDVLAKKSKLRLAADDNGFLTGRFNLTYTDEKGTASVVVRVEGLLMGNGESAGVASIDGDASGPWYVTIAPESAESSTSPSESTTGDANPFTDSEKKKEPTTSTSPAP